MNVTLGKIYENLAKLLLDHFITVM